MSHHVSKHLIYFIFAIDADIKLPSPHFHYNIYTFVECFLSPENINTIKVTFDWPLLSQAHCKYGGNSQDILILLLY